MTHQSLTSYIQPFIEPEKWANAKVYDIQNKGGLTDYIDFIRACDFPENCNLMHGVDKFRRVLLLFNFSG